MNKDKEEIMQFVKFALVGVANTAVDWIFFFVFNRWFNIARIIAKVLSFIVSVINSYLLNSNWTFKKEYKDVLLKGERKKVEAGLFSRFLIVSLVGLLINTLAYNLAYNNLGTMPTDRWRDIAALFVASASGIIWNFFANKLWTYK